MNSDSYIVTEIERVLASSKALAQASNLLILGQALRDAELSVKHPMQLAIFGKLSSSKSTFVNALLGSEVVSMGMMAETFNVSWLKYGSNDADITVVFKDGTTRSVPRSEWGLWSGQAENELKYNVRYIEVCCDYPILKHVNIIDTPGLDSSLEIDSQNTISFLKEIRPDAVVMIFTKAIAQSTLDVLYDFQNHDAGVSFRLSPINAMGIYAKIDTIWQADNPQRDPVDVANHVITYNLYHNWPQLREVLYGISPACALLGLAAFTLDETDVSSLRQLASVESSILSEMLMAAELLINDSYTVRCGLDSAERNRLRLKFDLWGIHLLTDYLREHPGCSPCELRAMLDTRSNMEDVRRRIVGHFGDRAVLIKTRNMAQRIAEAASRQRQTAPNKTDVINQIEATIRRTLMNTQEYRELDYLGRIYDGQVQATNTSALEEFKRVCGELGHSVITRLDLPSDATINDMTHHAQQKAHEANQKAQIAQLLNPNDVELFNQLDYSYCQLSDRIEEMRQRKAAAEQDLAIVNNFFYGN